MTSRRSTQARPASARPTAVITLALALAGVASQARADLTIQILNATANPGGTGSFDIVLKDDGGTFDVAGFSVEPMIMAGPGVSFTAADTLTSPATGPYIFGTYQSSPFPFATDPADPGMPATFPNSDFVAGDAYMSAPGFVTLNPGDVVGLAHVTFSVAASVTPGTVAVALVAGGNTSLSDGNGDPISSTAGNGTITVAAVPEPSAVVLVALGSILALTYSRPRLIGLRLAGRS
jgi:hypothetical protein